MQTIKEPFTAKEATDIFAALAQETRLEAYRLLLRYQPFGLAAGDISRLLAVPHNTLSGHLGILQGCGLICSRRQGRSIIYSVEPQRLSDVEQFLALGCADNDDVRSGPTPSYPSKRPAAGGADKIFSVLVLCTGNATRSLMAEAIINREGSGRFRAFSAGSRPRKKAHSQALSLLRDLGYETDALRPKSWLEFAGQKAPKMDFVITVCDRAAGEACPVWPGHPLAIHWGVPSVAELTGRDDDVGLALRDTYKRLINRFTALVNLPIEEMPMKVLKAHLAEISGLEGASELSLAGFAG